MATEARSIVPLLRSSTQKVKGRARQDKSHLVESDQDSRSSGGHDSSCAKQLKAVEVNDPSDAAFIVPSKCKMV